MTNVKVLSEKWQQFENLRTVIEVTLDDSERGTVSRASASPGGTPMPPADIYKWAVWDNGRLKAEVLR
jgi:hypothetical protein